MRLQTAENAELFVDFAKFVVVKIPVIGGIKPSTCTDNCTISENLHAHKRGQSMRKAFDLQPFLGATPIEDLTPPFS